MNFLNVSSELVSNDNFFEKLSNNTKKNQKYNTVIDTNLIKEVVKKWETRELNFKNAWEAMIDLNVSYPRIVFNQLVIETGNLKSSLCKNNNNLFGMKMPNRRFTWAFKKTRQNNSFYKHWIYSVLDIFEYQLTRKNKDYRSHLISSRFAKSKSYGLRMSKLDLTKKYNLNLNYVSDLNIYRIKKT